MTKSIDDEKESQSPSIETGDEVAELEAQGIAVPKSGFLHSVRNASVVSFLLSDRHSL